MIIPFGKYKGKSLEWIYFNDKSYFEWLENILNSGRKGDYINGIK